MTIYKAIVIADFPEHHIIIPRRDWPSDFVEMDECEWERIHKQEWAPLHLEQWFPWSEIPHSQIVVMMRKETRSYYDVEDIYWDDEDTDQQFLICEADVEWDNDNGNHISQCIDVYVLLAFDNASDRDYAVGVMRIAA